MDLPVFWLCTLESRHDGNLGGVDQVAPDGVIGLIGGSRHIDPEAPTYRARRCRVADDANGENQRKGESHGDGMSNGGAGGSGLS